MKMLYKMVLFMMLVNLITILINILGVFPPGSLPMSDRDIADSSGEVTATSIMTYYLGENTISLNIPILSDIFPGLSSIYISWGVIIAIFTITTLIISAIIKNAQPFVIGVMVLIMYSMINSSIKWFYNLSRNAGGVAYPSLIFIMSIIGFGILYLFLITIIESHTQGDVSDR